MADSVRDKLSKSIYRVLRSLCRIMLKHGIGYKDFSDLVKAAYVEVASEDFGIRGRPTNISRVAVMTGLTRKEVKRLRENGPGFVSVEQAARNPLAEILHHWNTDPDFCDSLGVPKALPYEGTKASFVELVKRYIGDIPPGAIRMELKRIDAVDELESGALIVKTRQHLPNDADKRMLNGVEFGLATLAATVVHNSKVNVNSLRPQKFIHTSKIQLADLPRITHMLKERLEAFTIETDDILSLAETNDEELLGAEGSQPTIGVGVYFYTEQND